jgi:hypothetical protein
MRNSHRTRRSWLARAALGLAIVAVAAPAAQGMVPGETSAGTSAGQVTDGLGRPLDPAAVKSLPETAIPVVDVSKFRLATQLDNEPVRPDDRAVRPAPGVVPNTGVVRPDDRAVRPTIDAGAPVVATSIDRPSFDWNDAGIGVGIGVAAALAVLVAWMLLGARKPDHFAGT